jgi:elongation factor Tu
MRDNDREQPRPPPPRAWVAAIGHHDHGMSTLTAAVVARQAHKNGLARFPTYQDITRGGTVRDELKTVSWAPRQVEYVTPGRHYHHSDCPGRLDTVKNTITLLAVADSAILVVAASDGPMPQTREHLVLARQASVPSVVVFLSKVDRVDDPELLALVEREVREALRAYGFPGDSVPVVGGNALAAMLSGGKDDRACAPIDALMDALDTATAGLVRKWDKPFMMSIDDVFSIKGRGTVGTGLIERGKVRVGDEVEIIGLMKQPRQTVVTGVDILNKAVAYATAGDHVGVLLRGIERTELERGQVLATPGSVTAHTKFEAGVSILTREEGGRTRPVFSGYKPQFYFGTTDVTGTVTLPEGVDMCLPGETVKMTVELLPEMPIAMGEGLRFAVRAGGSTVGFGVVTRVFG